MKIAQGTAGALGKIVTSAEKAAEMMGTISDASNDQATGVAQISRGIDQISQVVQVNAATAEQSAASSEELSSQSELLREKVGRFRLKAE
jgi:methyl-accepting chemotaxis protein